MAADYARLFQAILDHIDRGTFCALVQVLETRGSTPLKIGASAVIDSQGHITGTIGGGAVEAEAQQQAIEACSEGNARTFEFTMHGTNRRDSSPTCGGSMQVLVDPTVTGATDVMRDVVASMAGRQTGVLYTKISHDTPPEVTYHWQGQKLDEEAGSNETSSEFVHEDAYDVLRVDLIPPPHLIIAGAGHVGQALARQAVLIGFAVTVVDDRPGFCTYDLLPSSVTLRCHDMADALRHCPLGSDSYVVILTRGHQFDAAVLEACIQRPAAYIGMIGSRRKIAVMRKDFVTSGLVTEAQFDRVHAPIGLDIGAETAAEIAASIVAELIAVRRKGEQA